MLSVGETVTPSGAECPRIVSAVLKALRGEDEAVEAVGQMRAHVANCSACVARVSRLCTLVLALISERVEADSAAGDAPPAQPSPYRRRQRRLPTNEAVNLVFEDCSVTLARMLEVSAGGAKIESPEQLDLDERFTLNRGRRSTQVTVRHCNRQGDLFIIGVEYIRNAVNA